VGGSFFIVHRGTVAHGRASVAISIAGEAVRRGLSDEFAAQIPSGD
jgi:hypothetical protein